MVKHTPGPWSRDKYGAMIDAMGDSVILRGTSTLCSGSDDRMAIAEANTDLACAAPELLEALELLYAKRAEWIRGGDHPGEDDENHPMWTEMQKARAAIARARARGEA